MGFSPSSFTPSPDGLVTEATAMKWAALHDAAGVVAALAGFAQEQASAQIDSFPAAVRGAAPWRRELARKGVDDLAAIMEPGIAALLAVHGRGADAAPPARALWREFQAARDALLTLAVPEHA